MLLQYFYITFQRIMEAAYCIWVVFVEMKMMD